ncbi:YafY family protein [Nocardia implantans]|uniref:YafY family protein n=1 Tax=Nocardia implantans TaxID=3108168 RepID=A0ABU6AYF7_9NOCA|nr:MULTISPECIES: YafY family protein [unclassified Nocardia]MBF6194394.1 YafY family transcriptional regulator [Nocardia beijingensis]MEA3530001.1 YafY family protein [Nocardia sp. CDC192]MEB3512521.1 YafY family protein [Nocardia sp. CDC186]
MTQTAARLLQLLSLLQTRREWSGPELAARLGVTVRTVRRDVERLRELEYPVVASLGAIGGYRLEAGAALPPLLLDDEEAVAITLGLRGAAQGAIAGIEESAARALVKLQQVLPSRLRRRVDAIDTTTVSLGGPAAGPLIDPEVLVTLAAAARDGERIRFRYRDKTGTESGRLAEPHSLVSAGRRWYLVAWDVDRADWRTFRVDRLTAPRPIGIRCAPRALPTEDAASFVTSQLARSRPVRPVVLRVHASAATLAETFRVRAEEIEPLDERTCLLRTCADSLEWTALRIAHLDLDFEVVEPTEMRDLLAGLGAKLLRAAREPR